MAAFGSSKIMLAYLYGNGAQISFTARRAQSRDGGRDHGRDERGFHKAGRDADAAPGVDDQR